MNKAAFLDRDGVINRKAPEGRYVTRWEEVEFYPGVGEAIDLLKHDGFLVVIVTNQRCIARGLVTAAEVECMHRRMRLELEAAGARINAVYYCPHGNQPPCSCRKPKPGMLLQAARRYDVDLAESWMIGDSASDVQAGRAAGCNTVQLTEDVASLDGASDLAAVSLLDATHKILQVEATLHHSSWHILNVDWNSHLLAQHQL